MGTPRRPCAWGVVGRARRPVAPPPAAFARFARLRDARRAIASGDGVPPYVVMTDAMLAALAKMESPTHADLKKIEGMGDAKVKKYGARLLDALREASKGRDSADAAAGTDDGLFKESAGGAAPPKGGDAP